MDGGHGWQQTQGANRAVGRGCVGSPRLTEGQTPQYLPIIRDGVLVFYSSGLRDGRIDFCLVPRGEGVSWMGLGRLLILHGHDHASVLSDHKVEALPVTWRICGLCRRGMSIEGGTRWRASHISKGASGRILA